MIQINGVDNTNDGNDCQRTW
nr:hypothetical protein [Escherichia coli]